MSRLVAVLPLMLMGLSFAAPVTGTRNHNREQAVRSNKPSTPPGLHKIEHIIFIIKENRSFDTYFGTFASADSATRGKTSTGETIALTRTPDETPYDIGHGWQDALYAMYGGSMSHFDQVENGNVSGYLLPYTQMTQADIPNYFAYAHNFVLADRMFSSLKGPSFPNHLYTVAAQSGGALSNPLTSTYKWGCDCDENQTVLVEHEDGSVSAQPPCFDLQTLVDTMEKAHVTWKYYAPRERPTGINGLRWMQSGIYAAAPLATKRRARRTVCARRAERKPVAGQLACERRRQRTSSLE